MIDKKYIQVVLTIPNKEKKIKDKHSLLKIQDSFKRQMIIKDISHSHYNEDRIYLMSLFDFLLNPTSLKF